MLEGVRDLAQREFGLMARVVFRMWGIDRTDDESRRAALARLRPQPVLGER